MNFVDLPLRRAPGLAKRRSRRLRKKLRIAEFQEMGFEWSATLAPTVTAEQEDALLDALIALLEPMGLGMGGGVGGAFVSRYPTGSVSPEERAQIEAWLRGQALLTAVDVGPLHDVWYD